MLSLEDALGKLLASIKPIEEAEVVPIAEAVGRILATDVVARSSVPPFDNSAMDGWAVRSEDVRAAQADRPVVLECVGRIPAGRAYEGVVGRGECVRIFTGSPLPGGADAVVMQEDTRSEGTTVEILEGAKAWENVRFRGEDVKEGSVVGLNGDRVTAQQVALFSACGVGEVAVRRRVRVAVVATGDELKAPGEQLRPGEIFESNRVLISTLVQRLGFEAVIKPVVPDDLGETVAAIGDACEADAVITCGGVSVGEYDFVKDAILHLGGSIEMWRVAVKPGKPFAHAKVMGKPLFALPGNPVSALVTFVLLVRPALLRLGGASNLAGRVSLGKLGEEISNRGDRRHFVRVVVDAEGVVRVSGPQASHRLASLAAANGLLDVPAETTWEKGRMVKVIPLD